MKVRTLAPEEFVRLRTIGGPLGDTLRQTEGLPDPGHTKVGILEAPDGTIKGYIVLFDALHVEPIWLDPEVRHHPKAGGQLLDWIITEIKATGARTAFGIILEADQATVAPLALKLGFTPLPGTLYGVEVER